jgi:hypothetical protein
MPYTSHARDVREALKKILEAEDDLDARIIEGPVSEVQINFPLIVVGVVAERLEAAALGRIYDRILTVRIDCYEKDLDSERGMEKIEGMADKIIDVLVSNYALTVDSNTTVRLIDNFSIAYDLVAEGDLWLRVASITCTTETVKS